jgi:hydroxymethylglutaryl-CoA synthase
MAEHAAAFLFRHEWRDLPRWKEVKEKLGEEPRPEDFESMDEFDKVDNQFRKGFVKTELFRESYEKKILPSLEVSRQIGNIYTGSMYLAFCSMLEGEARKGKDLTDNRVGFGSYGSGCSSIVFSGIIPDSYRDVVEKLSPSQQIMSRRELSMIEYEALHEGHANHSVIAPKEEFVLDSIDEQGYRHYRYVE